MSKSPIRMGEPPKPGFYLRRLVRHGPLVGCQITFDSAEGFRVMEDGRWEGPSQDPWLLPLMHSVAFATPCEEAEVKYRLGLKKYAELYAPDEPAANPRKAIDIDHIIPF